MKILLAVDGSAGSEAATQEVATRPWPAGSEIKIISAAEPVAGPLPEVGVLSADYFELVKSDSLNRARTAVDRALLTVRQGAGRNLTITAGVIEAAPRQAILDEAERWQADLIVVGSHGYQGLQRWLLGSVSSAVATHAQCSVEIVRCREHGKNGESALNRV